MEPLPPPPERTPSPWADVRREYKAVRVDQAPVIDGRLDEAVWKLAEDGGPLVQALPLEGTEPSQRTAFRVLQDGENLYLGIWCYDEEPESIVAKEMAHDGRIYADDHVIVVLDTFLDRRNGYEFRVNPNGARGESLITDNIYLNESWDCIWMAAASIDSEGWKAEIAIPIQTLSFDPRRDTWGFNVFRHLKRLDEKNRWVAARPEISTFNVAEAGTLRGLDGLRQGLGLDLVPYVLGRYRRQNEADSNQFKGQAGGDARYRVTPNLTAQLSYNTDFAETEVDYRQINLTRFPLYYPEKRDFFLEDSGIFRFGNLGSSLIPFYSRTIGLDPDGNPVPILVASKVTGRESGFNVGCLDAVLDRHDDLNYRNAFVARVSRNILEQSSVGILTTYGDPNSTGENLLAGADAGYRTTRLFGDQVLVASAFGMGTWSEGGAVEGADSTDATGGASDSVSGTSYGANVSLPNDEYVLGAQMYEVGADFDPALGFVQRGDVRVYSGSATYQPRPEDLRLVRQFFFTYGNTFYTDLSGELQTASYSAYPLNCLFESGDSLFFNVNHQFDSPQEDFEIWPGVAIPAGAYSWTGGSVGIDTANKRAVEFEAGTGGGTFYDGEKQNAYGAVDWKPVKYAVLRISYSYNEVRLPEGDFDTQLALVRLQTSASPDLNWFNLWQYDDLSKTVGWNSRVVWEFHPGAFLYLVVNQIVQTGDASARWIETEAIGKLGVTFRF